jgi:cytochrome c oxidase subunit 1
VSLEVIAVFAGGGCSATAMVSRCCCSRALDERVGAPHVHHGPVANEYFSLTSTALLVPAGIEYFDAAATLVGGSLLLRTPMLFALSSSCSS